MSGVDTAELTGSATGGGAAGFEAGRLGAAVGILGADADGRVGGAPACTSSNTDDLAAGRGATAGGVASWISGMGSGAERICVSKCVPGTRRGYSCGWSGAGSATGGGATGAGSATGAGAAAAGCTTGAGSGVGAGAATGGCTTVAGSATGGRGVCGADGSRVTDSYVIGSMGRVAGDDGGGEGTGGGVTAGSA